MGGSIRVAQKVRIGIDIGNGHIIQFFSYIKKIYPDRLLLIFPESKANFAKYLKEGISVRLSVYTPIGILLMDSIVFNEPVNCEFEVEFERAQKRIQRRRFVRAKANYRIIIEHEGKTCSAISEDIGGGGIRFICDSNLQGAIVSAKLFIPDYTEGIAFTGRVETKQRFRPNEYLIEFMEIEEIDRNKIIQNCLELEAKSLRDV